MGTNFFSQCNCNASQSRKQLSHPNLESCQSKRKTYLPTPNTGIHQLGMQYSSNGQPHLPAQAYLTGEYINSPTMLENNESEPINPAFAGYWFAWSLQIDLATIPAYNIIIVAFMQTGPDGIPTFRPMYMTDEQFRTVVDMLKCQGREVLISLGGAHGNISLTQSDKQAFIDETIQVVDKYGFTGIDISLDYESAAAADNQTVIPDALMKIKNYYALQGRKFMITLAPEFPSLRGADALYLPYIQGLEGYYDLIFPQYYNQDSDGIWSYELDMWLSQDDNEYKAQFLYTLTHAIVTGTQNYIQIPADKLAIGLPASRDAAFDGYVEDPNDVIYAFNRLDDEGNCIRGLMTWAINFDAVNRYQFVSNYAPLVFSRCVRCAPPVIPPTPIPCPPENLRANSIAYSSIGLEWNPCPDNPQVFGYAICRNNLEVGRVLNDQTSFLDTGLAPNTEYAYTVRAFDSNNNYSEPSNELFVATSMEQYCN